MISIQSRKGFSPFLLKQLLIGIMKCKNLCLTKKRSPLGCVDFLHLNELCLLEMLQVPIVFLDSLTSYSNIGIIYLTQCMRTSFTFADSKQFIHLPPRPRRLIKLTVSVNKNNRFLMLANVTITCNKCGQHKLVTKSNNVYSRRCMSLLLCVRLHV